MEVRGDKTEIAKLFFEVEKNLKRNMYKFFEDSGITLSQSLVIATLINYGEMKITDLSKKINLSNSTVSGIVDRLEKQELVIKRRSEKDRRIVYVKVAPKFERIHKGMNEKMKKKFEDLLSKATPGDIEKIIEGLTTLKRVLNERD